MLSVRDTTNTEETAVSIIRVKLINNISTGGLPENLKITQVSHFIKKHQKKNQ